jgi:hypothetical protein
MQQKRKPWRHHEAFADVGACTGRSAGFSPLAPARLLQGLGEAMTARRMRELFLAPSQA